MRAILIPILICLLSQFTLVECVKKQDPSCVTKYKCIAPQRCADGNSPLKHGDLAEVTLNVDIFDDCAAIFRYHAYADNLMHVSIESFDATITSVQFLTGETADHKRKFSCTFDGVKATGEYFVANNHKSNRVQISVSNTLKCEFVLKLGPKEIVIPKASTDMNVQFRIKDNQNIEVDTKSNNFNYKARCDPKNIIFNQEDISSRRKYTKVLYEFGNFLCDEPDLFKIEYRKDDLSKYESNLNPECDGKNFMINDERIDHFDSIEVRCFADAQYFCNYKPVPLRPKSAEYDDLVIVSPKIEINRKSELKCPITHPYLRAAGFPKPLIDYKFECLNHGSDVYWTIDDVAYAQNGRKASCTNELKCSLMQKILERSIPNGQLDTIGFPECFERGILYLDIANKELVTGTRCDTRTGEYKYFLGKAENRTEYVVREDTKFTCDYPTVIDVKQNEANEQIMNVTQICIFTGLGVVCVAILIAGVYFSWKRIQKKKKRAADQEKIDDAYWIENVMDAEERKAYNKKKKEAENNDLPLKSMRCADPSKLSAFMTSIVLTGLQMLSPGGAAVFRAGDRPKPKECDDNGAGRDDGIYMGNACPVRCPCPLSKRVPSTSPAQIILERDKGGYMEQLTREWKDKKETDEEDENERIEAQDMKPIII